MPERVHYKWCPQTLLEAQQREIIFWEDYVNSSKSYKDNHMILPSNPTPGYQCILMNIYLIDTVYITICYKGMA